MKLHTNDPREVPARKTPLTFREAAHAIDGALQRILGTHPTVDTLAVFLAQTALETGRWESLWCYNFGNVKASKYYRGHHCYFRCNEVLGGRVVWFDPPHPQTRFRAYASATEGAEAHLRFLSDDTNGDGFNRYGAAWGAALNGQPNAFVVELKSAGYFTADLDAYARAVRSLFRAYRENLTRSPITLTPPAPAPERSERSAFSDEDLKQLVEAQQFDLYAMSEPGRIAERNEVLKDGQ